MGEDKQNKKFVLIKLKEGTPIYQKAKEKLDDGDFKYFGIRKNNYSDIIESKSCFNEDKPFVSTSRTMYLVLSII